MKKNKMLMVGLLLFALVFLAACGGGEETPPATEEAAEEGPLVIYVTSKPLGTNQFHIMGRDALSVLEEEYGVQTDYYESENDPTNRENNLRAAVNAGADLVYVLGTEWLDILPQVASENPDVEFLHADQCPEEQSDNLHCVVFKEYEATFLLGVMAGNLTENNKVGAVGALDIPFLHRYTDPYVEGAQYVNPEITSEIRWVGGDNPFGDPARAKEQVLAVYSTGADVILSATAGGDSGSFEAAQEEGFLVFGVDVNNCPEAPGHIVDNMLKHIDLAVVEAVGRILNDNPDALFLEAGVAEGAVGPGAITDDPSLYEECVIMEHPDIIEQVEEARDKIINGEIEIEDPMFAE